MKAQPIKPAPTILEACSEVFADSFRDAKTWNPWFAFLAALFGLPMTPEQLAIYQQCTGRVDPPTTPASEGWLVCGRRSGKSFAMALCAVYLGCFREYRPYLQRGQRATIMVVAQDRKAVRNVFNFIDGLLRGSPMLERMIQRETLDTFELRNQVNIEIQTASHRSTRGYAIPVVIADEVSFWPTDSASESDEEILSALKPGMAQFPNRLLLCGSSPYAKRGALYEAHKRYFGKDDDGVMVWQASTTFMNPLIDQAWVDREIAKDPVKNAAEYGATFRSDVDNFVSRDAVDAVTVKGRIELPPKPGVVYTAFTDPNSGGADAFTLSIAHMEDGVAVEDLLRGSNNPNPEMVVAEYAKILQHYGISVVYSDNHAKGWVTENWSKHGGIEKRPAFGPKTEIYAELLPWLNSRKIQILDHPKRSAQLIALERSISRTGHETISHPPNAHDDLINATAGALMTAARNATLKQRIPIIAPFVVSNGPHNFP